MNRTDNPVAGLLLHQLVSHIAVQTSLLIEV